MCHFHQAWHSGAQHPHFRQRMNRFAQHAGAWFDRSAQAPVNIVEKKDWYEMYVFAPGLNKDAFEVAVQDDVLSVRFKQAGAGDNAENWVHREFQRDSFERSFRLNGKVDTASITARYTDGVLELTLPKLPGTEGQTVAVA